MALAAVGFSLFFVTQRGFAGFWCGAPHRGDVKINAIMEIALRSKVLTEIAHENRPRLRGRLVRKLDVQSSGWLA